MSTDQPADAGPGNVADRALARQGAAGVAAVELRGVTKRFPGVVANAGIDLTVYPGEIHALLGENGAGKSTLMNILFGLYQPDEGEIRLWGRPVRFTSPRDAIAHRVGMVHQHFMLVNPFTVAENVMLGHESSRAGWLDQAAVEARVRELSQQYGLAVDPRARVGDLPVGLQQRVEILKALDRGADILILDEPTAVLTPQETEELLRILRGLAGQGKAIIFITHKLREVLVVADRITVLRAGRVVGTVANDLQAATPPSEASLAAMMVGRPVLLRVDKAPARPGPAVLEVDGLTMRDDRHLVAVDGISLAIHAGEILGLAGVEGNGQTELVEALTGLRLPEHGRIRLAGRDLTGAPPAAFIEAGVAHIPADRQKYGLVLSQSVADNLVLSEFRRPPYARGIRRVFAAVIAHARQLIRAFDIRTPSPRTPVGALSGGNQQKTVTAREFSRPIKLLIAANPTRGVDVGSIEFIHRKIVEARDRGVAILLISPELDEILSLADRIAVIAGGRIVSTVASGEATAAELGLLMTGGRDGRAVARG